jgi:hypothetical protein
MCAEPKGLERSPKNAPRLHFFPISGILSMLFRKSTIIAKRSGSRRNVSRMMVLLPPEPPLHTQLRGQHTFCRTCRQTSLPEIARSRFYRLNPTQTFRLSYAQRLGPESCSRGPSRDPEGPTIGESQPEQWKGFLRDVLRDTGHSHCGHESRMMNVFMAPRHAVATALW